MHQFELLISTKNRRDDLLFTLGRISGLLSQNVTCRVFDDGSDDGTSDAVKANFPQIGLLRNDKSKGYLFCRNHLLNTTTADFAISLDDDAHFLSDDPISRLSDFFDQNQNCGLVAFRIFWGKDAPETTFSSETSHPVKSFVGCGHAWRMSAWKTINPYPEWFEFYGEENTASLELFKKGWQVSYVPEVLVHHRVDQKLRRTQSDRGFRKRRSLRAGWYMYFLYFPISKIPAKMAYSVWSQFRNHVFRGEFQALKILFLCTFDLVVNLGRISKESNRLTKIEFAAFSKLPEARIYWHPKKENR
ncbi:glycosyltransferase [Flavobacterium sp.]|uniref:glycosyltransferase family 2 protein n=1 Tax=Flavobacterium sp. TaxID=239 RepID=UPI001222AA6A|nr:glycosyltransferase [Flavobacterium sp.]RZJ70862.1 MAG: glycosyltransferase [Flavobacterium sp.]